MHLESYKIILLKPLYRFDNNINEKKNLDGNFFLRNTLLIMQVLQI